MEFLWDIHERFVMKIKMIQIVTILLVFDSYAVKAQANFVFNGQFDSNTNGWVLANGASWPWVGHPGFSVDLSDVTPSLANDPTASQTINSLTPVANYIVSGDYAMGKDYGGGSATSTSFGVFIDGVVYFETIAPGNQDWHSFSFIYTATSSSAVLSLSAQLNGTGVSYFIDNIAMYAVPEPSASLLILLGGGLFHFARLACKKSSSRI
jgi:hypothetical protein